MLFLIDYWLILLGFIVGLIVGITSVGTGVIGMSSLYVFYSDVYYPNILVGSNTIQGTGMKGFGSLLNFLRRTLHKEYILLISFSAIPFTIFGAYTTKKLFELNLFEVILSIILIIASILIVYETYFLPKIKLLEFPIITKKKKFLCILFGALIGFIAGMTSIGTGTLMISILILVIKLPPKIATSIAIFEGSLILFASSISHFLLGNFDFSLVISMIIGSIPGMAIGTKINEKIDVKPLRYAVAIVIFIASLRILIKIITGNNFIVI